MVPRGAIDRVLYSATVSDLRGATFHVGVDVDPVHNRHRVARKGEDFSAPKAKHVRGLFGQITKITPTTSDPPASPWGNRCPAGEHTATQMLIILCFHDCEGANIRAYA